VSFATITLLCCFSMSNTTDMLILTQSRNFWLHPRKQQVTPFLTIEEIRRNVRITNFASNRLNANTMEET